MPVANGTAEAENSRAVNPFPLDGGRLRRELSRTVRMGVIPPTSILPHIGGAAWNAIFVPTLRQVQRLTPIIFVPLGGFRASAVNFRVDLTAACRLYSSRLTGLSSSFWISTRN